MTTTTIHAGYVITEDGTILIQVPDPSSHWGFYLADDDQSWDGGFGVASEWEALREDDPRITPEVRERLQWILDDFDSTVMRPILDKLRDKLTAYDPND